MEKVVVAAVVVLGSETAEAWGLENLITRGTRASKSVKHDRGPSKLLVSSSALLNNRGIFWLFPLMLT